MEEGMEYALVISEVPVWLNTASFSSVGTSFI